MNGNETGVNMNSTILMMFMNGWLGRPLNENFDKIFEKSTFICF